MGDVVELDENRPHRTLEVMCVKCFHRWQAVAPVETSLVQYECADCGPGYVIGTGQWIDD